MDFAEDVFQEVCLRPRKYQEQLRDPNYFQAWLFQIVRSAVIKLLKKSNWDVEVSFEENWNISIQEIDQSADPRQKAARMELAKILQEEIGSLKSNMQEMINLWFFAGLNLREISEVLNIPQGTVWYEMNMALKKFVNKQEYPVGKYIKIKVKRENLLE